MHTSTTIQDLQNILEPIRCSNRIGLVPTMGSLHAGHVSLIEECRRLADYVVLSVFVNPIQFNSAADLQKYPRNLEQDSLIAQKAGADLVFAPGLHEIFPNGYGLSDQASSDTRILAGNRSNGLCGESRPGHFNGVVTIVGQLFNLIRPRLAVFGEKDFQQLQVIRQMVADLHYQIEIIGAPLIRDADGLALSSRNALLSEAQRSQALSIYRSMHTAQADLTRGQRDCGELKRKVIAEIGRGGLRVDYVEIVDRSNLESLERIEHSAQLIVAAFCGDVRLIDNIRLDSPRDSR
ncbi:MAG: pantoate--beta-alanine ligase [Bdellovibrionales bacterium]|nr:pantoate--beta-alanine ligase [Bdellovibrionales bacterium]